MMGQPYSNATLVVPDAERGHWRVMAVGILSFVGYLVRVAFRLITLLVQRPSASIQQRLPTFPKIAPLERDSTVSSQNGIRHLCWRSVASTCSRTMLAPRRCVWLGRLHWRAR